MAIKSQKYRITWPLNAEMVSNIDMCIEDLYRQLGSSALGIMLGASAFDIGDVLYVSSTGDIEGLDVGSLGTFLQSDGTLPKWSAFSFPSVVTQGDLLYASSSSAVVSLAKDTNATRYLSNTGTSNNPAWAQISLTTGITGVLPVVNGGTNRSSWTAGSVVFVGAGGTSLTQDNANFFWDDTNNFLGIGLSNPSHSFDVNKDPGVAGTVVFAGLGDLVGTNPLFYLQGSDGTAAVRSRNAHPLAFWTNDTEQLRITVAGLLAFGGGGTSSFPALKRSLAVLEVRLADDSAYAELRAKAVTVDATGTFEWAASSTLKAPSDGIITLLNVAENNFGRLQFGGTTSSFPAIKRDGATLDFRLADDSDWVAIDVGPITSNGGSISSTGSITAVGSLRAGATGTIFWDTRGSLKSPADSIITLYNNAENNFDRLQFGGTSSSFPAWKRSSAELHARLADETGDAVVQCLRISTANAATFHTSKTTLTDGAGIGSGTITNAPSAGNPTKWIGIDDNGTTRYIPAW